MRRIILILLMVVFIIAAMVSLYKIHEIELLYNQSREALDNLKSSKIDIEFLKELHEENSDCVAWINIEDTEIDYPVMYHPEEEEFYLRRNFDKEYDICGLPYISEKCEPGISKNIIIYGHNMMDGSMFAELVKYKKRDFYEKHNVIRLYTLSGVDDYQVVSVFTVPVYTSNDFEYYNFTGATAEDDFNSFKTNCKKNELYSTGESFSIDDELLTLSTCEYSTANGRMVIVAKKIYKIR